MKIIPVQKDCRCKEFWSQTRFGGGICLYDVNRHKIHSLVWCNVRMWWVLNLTHSSVIYYVPVITCRHLMFVLFSLQGFCCVWNSCFSWDMRWLALLGTRSERDAMQGLLNRCATNADCRLADWQVNDQVNIVAVCVCRTPLINFSSPNRWFWFFLYSFKPNTILSFLLSDLDIVIHPPEGDPPATWWDDECDKSLLVGVYKYGEY